MPTRSPSMGQASAAMNKGEKKLSATGVASGSPATDR